MTKKIQNGRRQKNQMPNQDKFKLKDDQNKFKWKTTKKIKMEDNQKRFK